MPKKSNLPTDFECLIEFKKLKYYHYLIFKTYEILIIEIKFKILYYI